ncbi:MAG: hypothetical protein ABFD75_11445 [Smithella sp.]
MLSDTAFYLDILCVLSLTLGVVPTAVYMFFVTLAGRDFKTFAKMCSALCCWLIIFILYLKFGPNGEISSSNYSGKVPILLALFSANLALMMYLGFIHQTKKSNRSEGYKKTNNTTSNSYAKTPWNRQK